MDFCPQLSAFQGVIISSDNVHPFSRLTSKAGNEEKYKDVIQRLSNFLRNGQYIGTDGVAETALAKVRKFAFFLVLNADLSVLSELASLDEIELFIWTIPTIPKCLMCELFWQLGFNKFIYETIAFCCPELSLEVASAFIDNIKYYTPHECLNKLGTIGSALYKLLCRYNFFNFSPNMLSDKLTIVCNNFQKTIKFFCEPPKSERLDTLSRNDKYKYIGNCLYAILQLVEECMDEYLAVQVLSPMDNMIYKLTYISEHVKTNINYKVSDNPNQLIFDSVNKCNTALLDICQEIVMIVSVDIYCSWSEFNENDSTMQVRIGELCYRVRNKLIGIPIVNEHPVINMTEQISRKPIDLNDIARAANINTIVENINNSEENRITWLQALIQKENVYQDGSNVQCIMSNLSLFNQDECYAIYKNVRNYMTGLTDNVEYLEVFIVELFQRCTVGVKYNILEERFSNKCFVDMCESIEFSNAMTETFNKLVNSSGADLENVLCLFLQSPQKVYAKIFTLAADNAQQTNIMLKVMELLEIFSNHYYSTDTEPCIIRITVNTFDALSSDVKQNNFINFVCGLKNANSISGTKLLLLVIMPIMHKALLSKDVNSLNTQCKLLKDAYTLEELLPYRAPMLAMIGQVMDKIRWKINTYDDNAPAALQLAIDLQTSIINSYGTDLPDNECDWLKSKLRNMLPMNMYYYRKLWDPPGRSYVEVITATHIIDGMATVQLITRLSQLLYSATQQEWLDVWDSLVVFDHRKKLELLSDAFSLIAMVERMHRTDITWACMLYCYRTFIYTIRYKFLTEPLNESQVSIVIDKLIIACKFSLDDNSEELSIAILPLFAYLSERKADYTLDISQYLRTKMINPKHDKFVDLLLNVFTNGVD